VPRIGVLLNSSRTENLRDLREGLRELGYIEGQTIALNVLTEKGHYGDYPLHQDGSLVKIQKPSP
jgi:hypothetical protein